MKKLLFAASILLPSSAYAGSTATVQTGVSYGPDPAEVMNIVTPPSNNFSLPRPLVVMVHGGSFTGGDKNAQEARSVQIAELGGYVVANINYRLSSGGFTTAQIEDTQLAIRFMRANAIKYGVNPGYVCVDGWSAGGTLVLSAVLNPTILPGDRSNMYPTQSVAVKCIADNSGPTTFQPNGNGASPLSLVNSASPPIYISHGTHDPLVPWSGSAVPIASAYKKLGIYNVENYYNGGHILNGLTTAQQQAVLKAEIAFFMREMYP